MLICADEIERGKPDPQGYLTAAARLHRSADECVVIEDAPLGIAAARAARMRVIAIAATYARDRLASADAVVETLADLTIRSDADGVQIDIR